MAEKKTIKSYYDAKRLDWYSSNVDFESAKEQHSKNILACIEAQKLRKVKDRPLYVAVFHGSGRHPKWSCAQEKSNSQLFLDRAIETAKNEWKGRPVEIETHVLREYIMDPCNACYSTASALCHFTCSCFPGDDISTKIYPSIMKADVLLWSTPVNQAGPSTRMKTVIDRLISLDGGYFVQELPIKNGEYRHKAIELSTKEEVHYDPRMFGKVSAYFITGKDFNNEREGTAKFPKEFASFTFKDTVLSQLVVQGTDFSWYHADPYYAIMGATPDQDLSYDKAEYDLMTKQHEQAKKVVLAAWKLGNKHIEKFPDLLSLDRVNRT